jgi:hypothetical protein
LDEAELEDIRCAADVADERDLGELVGIGQYDIFVVRLHEMMNNVGVAALPAAVAEVTPCVLAGNKAFRNVAKAVLAMRSRRRTVGRMWRLVALGRAAIGVPIGFRIVWNITGGERLTGPRGPGSHPVAGLPASKSREF